MSVLTVYSRLYLQCFQLALKGVRNNAWTLILPALVIVAFQLLVLVAAQFGFAGGILFALGRAAIFSAYLYFVGEVVAHSTVSLAELKKSIGVYFWSLVNLSFVIFVANLLLGMFLRGSSQGATLLMVLNLLLLIALNAAPEVIYQRGSYGGIATIRESVEFLQQNWLEWIVPNLPLFLIGYLFYRLALGSGLIVVLVLVVVAGALAQVAMVFRGHVFAALVGSSHRQRMFKYRNA